MSNKVFFFGAGFSKAINGDYPLLTGKDGLTNRVLRDLKNDNGDDYEKKSIQQHFKEIPQSLTDNIEELLTYLSSDLPWKDERQKAMNKALYIDITNKIVKIFESINNYDFADCNSKQFQKNKALWEFIYKENITCVSLNYDLLLEKNLIAASNIIKKQDEMIINIQEEDSCGKFYKIPILNIINRVSNSCSYRYELPEILKLHGSINWLYSSISPSDSIFYRDFQKVENNLIEDLVPFIIPPILDKNSFYNNNTLKSIWKRAHTSIKSAEEIYIVGFSFPLTDLPIKLLFQSALRKNNDVKVYVINPDNSDEFKSRYKHIFTEEQLQWDFCGIDNSLEKFINNKVLNNNLSEAL
ncbi:MAG: hypothetical protein ACD_20C00131G0001 [uncultured bacterium]|nr:MAG: hypothetical protein ACD_20C00131G0001 [uncultured bacterium]HBH18415.1 hypothetical protein [Cyanobacteria bacterium UBA9579]